MDPRSSSQMLFAPGSSSHAVSAPSREPTERQPPIDENVLAEGCGYEIVDGQVYELAPAEEEHGTEHFQLPAVLGAHLAPEYKGTVDMLSRPTAGSNFAPDVSIVARARDPQTGGRRIEDLIFEVIDSESLAHVTDKTRKLLARGVRRAFVIDVNDRSVREWSRDDDGWRPLADDATIADRCFQVPVPARALVDEVLAEDTVALALIARGNPVLARREQEAEARAEKRGRLAGRREALRALAKAAGVALDADDEARVDACDDAATLDRWIANGRRASTTQELFA